jgi:flagellar hook assembly protein FlgD
LTQTTNLTLDVYDINGKLVKILANQVQKPGHYTIPWDRHDEHQNELPDGIYFLQFTTDRCKTTNKIVIND